MSIETRNYTIKLGMGKGMGKKWGGWEQIPELSKKDIKNLDTIGYTGKLNGEKMIQSEYLARLLNKDVRTVSAFMSKFDNGEFSEEYTVIISEYIPNKS